MSLVQRIRQRAFRIYLTSDASPAEARKLAAKELAQAQKQRQSKDRLKPAAANVSGVRRAFMQRLFDGLGRLREQPQARPQTVPHVLHRVPEPSVVIARAKPEPPADQIIGVYVGRAGGAELISEDEYAASMRSPVYTNWIDSIRDAERRARERRQNRWIG
jgi:hypothetical protein